MSLLAKIFHEESPTMSAHSFAAILRLYFAGEANATQSRTAIESLLTLSNNGTAYVLTASEITQLTEFTSYYDGLPNADAKRDHFALFEAGLILANYGDGVLITKSQFKTINGVSTD